MLSIINSNEFIYFISENAIKSNSASLIKSIEKDNIIFSRWVMDDAFSGSKFKLLFNRLCNQSTGNTKFKNFNFYVDALKHT